jgi:hypothetical protein
MNTIRKVLISVLVTGAVGGAAAFGAFSAFSSTTSNPGNSFQAGSVTLADNDAGTALYDVTGKKPGQYAERCIKVTYSGSLPANVRLYRSTFSGGTGLDAYIDLSITKGTGDAGDCSDFSGSTSVFSGVLNTVGSDFTGGVALTNAGGSAAWAQDDAVTYKVRATLQDNNGANGKVTGTHSFTWEAQNT